MNGLKTLNKYSINVRTLKEIGFNPHALHLAFPDYVEELREAAKEWVHELENIPYGYDDEYPAENKQRREAQIEWINHFFNLEDKNK